MSIYIIDEIMGRGKTSAMINYINETPDSEKFLFITPYLTEVDRIQQACTGKHFVAPSEDIGKLNSIKELFKRGDNIASTHALFAMLDKDAIEYVLKHKYSLVVDEVMPVIAPVPITSYDAAVITREYASTADDGRLTWDAEDYTGRLDVYKTLIQNGDIHRYNDSHWIKIMSKELFMSFKNVYIMTYMFEHQIHRCFFDLNNIPYERKYVAGDSVETYRLTDTPEPTSAQDYSCLIHIIDKPGLNRIGENEKYDFGYGGWKRDTTLSKGWYQRNSNSKEITQLRKSLYNYYHNIVKTPADQNLWTTFCKDASTSDAQDWPKYLARSGYTQGFLPCNARGTNQYRHKTALAYLINVYPNTSIRNYLKTHGIALDQEYYALSEMLQWIWRSAIRDGKEISIYIPSRRMRNLLIQWIDNCQKGGQAD